MHLHNHLDNKSRQYKCQGAQEASDKLLSVAAQPVGVSGRHCHTHGVEGDGQVCAGGCRVRCRVQVGPRVLAHRVQTLPGHTAGERARARLAHAPLPQLGLVL